MQQSLRIEPRHPRRFPSVVSTVPPQSSETQPYYSFGNLEKRPRDVKLKIDNQDS